MVGRGNVVVDIGAARGLWSARLLQLVGAKGRVHAFEPLPKHEKHLWPTFLRRLCVHPGRFQFYRYRDSARPADSW